MTNRVHGVKKSAFLDSGATAISDSATFDYVDQGVNKKISFAELLKQLGTTGALEQVGDPTCTPVLDDQGAIKGIRNIAGGAGIDIGLDGTGCIQVTNTSVPVQTAVWNNVPLNSRVELKTLSDGVTERTPGNSFRILDNGNLFIDAYPNTRDDGMLLNILGTDALGNLIAGPNQTVYIGGHFVDLTDQAIAVAGTPQSVDFSTNLLLSEVSHVPGSDLFTVNDPGVFGFIVAPQLGQGSGAATVEFWIEKNGTAIPNSGIQLSISANAEELPLLRWTEILEINDTFKIMFASDSLNTKLDNITSAYGGPNIPSIMLGLNHFGDF